MLKTYCEKLLFLYFFKKIGDVGRQVKYIRDVECIPPVSPTCQQMLSSLSCPGLQLYSSNECPLYQLVFSPHKNNLIISQHESTSTSSTSSQTTRTTFISLISFDNPQRSPPELFQSERSWFLTTSSKSFCFFAQS